MPYEPEILRQRVIEDIARVKQPTPQADVVRHRAEADRIARERSPIRRIARTLLRRDG